MDTSWLLRRPDTPSGWGRRSRKTLRCVAQGDLGHGFQRAKMEWKDTIGNMEGCSRRMAETVT